MAINNYFQRGRGVGRDSEQNLTESMIIEAIKIAGQDFYYIKRTQVQLDPLFNENPLAYFQNYAILEMYVNNAEAFGGNGYELSKFGMDVHDTVDLVVSKKRVFEELNISVPNPGDLIYWPLGRTVFQIDFVKDETLPMYALSNLYCFMLNCSRFTYSYEQFDTGIPNVDELNNINIPFAENTPIKDEANGIMDFSEGNPFGEVAEPDSNS